MTNGLAVSTADLLTAGQNGNAAATPSAQANGTQEEEDQPEPEAPVSLRGYWKQASMHAQHFTSKNLLCNTKVGPLVT